MFKSHFVPSGLQQTCIKELQAFVLQIAVLPKTMYRLNLQELPSSLLLITSRSAELRVAKACPGR